MHKSLITKAFISILGILLLIYIAVHFHYSSIQKAQAPYIESQVVLAELEKISIVRDDDMFSMIEEIVSDDSKEYLSYGQYLKLKEIYPSEDFSFENNYKRKRWKMSLADWNEYFEKLVLESETNRISVKSVLVVGDASIVSTEEKLPLEENRVLTSEGIYFDDTIEKLRDSFSCLKLFFFEDRIISIMDRSDEAISLKNCYVVNDSKDQIQLMKGAYFISLSDFSDTDLFDHKKEEIVDVVFQKGKLIDLKQKTEYINGKILRLNSQEIEIENYGVFPLDEDMEIYRLYQNLKSLSRKDLPLGYDFTDFVLEDDKVVACLLMREEYMENIRVLLRTDHLEKKYHEKIILYCDEEMELSTYKDGILEESKLIPAGEKLEFSKDDFAKEDEEGHIKRMKLLPSVLSGRIFLTNVQRTQGIPSYKGSMEITELDEGLVIINEVLLEDYLKQVVPSEMPSYYPLEALKAQAVCARTYAYGKMVKTGLPQYGAHVDDSAAFQVYNNIQSRSETTEAVNASYHEILRYDKNPIGTYYYSTSPGCGTEIGIWHGNAENPEYLMPKELALSASTELPYALMEEDVFRQFISKINPSHFESEEGWYRWKVHKLIDVEALMEVLESRYELYPDKILVKNEDGMFESRPIPSLGRIKNMEITKRMAGGIADELVISGEDATIKIISELNIRHILAAGGSEVERQSGDISELSMLPSAFVVMDLENKDGYVSGYTLTGGGFGHGIGMSQNGAKNMAKQGMNYKEILNFYYTNAEINTLSKNES